MAIDSTRLNDVREGRRGIALALYFDIDDEEWGDYCSDVSSVLALDEPTSRRVLEAVRSALETGGALEVRDDASDAVNIVLASALKDQVLVARLLDSVGGRPSDSLDAEITFAG